MATAKCLRYRELGGKSFQPTAVKFPAHCGAPASVLRSLLPAICGLDSSDLRDLFHPGAGLVPTRCGARILVVERVTERPQARAETPQTQRLRPHL